MKELIILILFSAIIYSQVNDLNNIFQQARNFEKSAEYEKAEILYKKLTMEQPSNNLFFESLNRVLVQQKKYNASINLLEERIRNFPNDINAYGLLGSTYHIKGEIDQANEIWDTPLNVNPGSPVNYRLIANYAIESRAIDMAIDILERGRNRCNDPTLFSLDLASLYAGMMQFDRAVIEYCNILLRQPEQLNSIKARIGNYLFRSDALHVTIDYVKTFINKYQTTPLLELLIHLYKYTGQFDEAFSYLRLLTEKFNPTEKIIFEFANEALDKNQFKTSCDAFELLIAHYPNSPNLDFAKLGYTKSLEAFLQAEESNNVELWNPFISMNQTNLEKYNNVLSRYLSLVSSSNKSEIICESFFRSGLILKNIFKRLDSADSLFNIIINLFPGSQYLQNAYVQLSDDAIRLNKLDQAEKYLQKAIEFKQDINKQQTYARYLEAKIDFWQNNFHDASRLLSEFTKDLSNELSNDAVELLLLTNIMKVDSVNLSVYSRADLLLYQKKYSPALETFNSLALSETNIIIRELSKLNIVQILISQNKFPEAIAQLHEIINSDKSKIFADKALFLLAQIYQYGFKNSIKALSIYENLLAKYPNSLYLDKARENIMFLKPNH